MSDLFAILYAPGSGENTKKSLAQKLSNIIDQFNIGKTNIKVNPKFPINVYWEGNSDSLLTVVIGWGLKAKPSWKTILPELKDFGSVRQLIAIDLFERKGLDERLLEEPMVNAGRYWSKKMQQYKQNLFFEDYFLMSSVPYGLKKVKVSNTEKNDYSPIPRFASEPGEPSEVEIVKLIFDLFVGHDYNLSEICNLLNAQEIKAPKNSKVWSPRSIKTTLKCPLYIGANKFREFIKFDVFTSIIEQSVYFEAQAKISQMSILAGSMNFK